MDEKETQKYNSDYTVFELIQQLSEDDSWEPDPEYRQKAIGMMIQKMPSC